MPDDRGGATERLRELQRLRDEGLISDAELDERRTRILDETFGSGETEIASSPEADEPGESGADAPGDQGATVSRTPGDQPRPDPPGERVVNPARWPNWLRITAIVVSGVWIVSIPFMLWRAARYTWLPYLGVGTVPLIALVLVAGGDSEDPGRDSTGQAPRPTATAPANTRESSPTAAAPDVSSAETRSGAQQAPPAVITTDGGTEIRLETRRQAEIILYYREILRYFGPSDHNLSGWRDATTLYQTDRVSNSDYYRYTRSAYDAHHYLANKWINEGPVPPDGLHEVSSVVSGVLEKRGDAMGHAAAAIETGDTEEAFKSIELLKQATAGVLFVVGKMLFAANESGINTDALQHVVHCDEESQVCKLRSPTRDTPLLLSGCPHGVTDTELSVCKGASSQN
ncbi:MAG: hypothetical protein F4Z25_12125 [Chloroflexi bacterium]|nr:hypothetical protein [Chloroflexota bacterium]